MIIPDTKNASKDAYFEFGMRKLKELKLKEKEFKLNKCLSLSFSLSQLWDIENWGISINFFDTFFRSTSK